MEQHDPQHWPRGLAGFVASRFEGGVLRAVRMLGKDDDTGGGTHKGLGYGVPLQLDVELKDGQRRTLVLHFARADQFGHDRRSDRAEAQLLSYDTFGAVPGHVSAVDVGTLVDHGDVMVSLRDSGEFWLLTEWAQGEPYANDLRSLGAGRALTDEDLRRCDALVAQLHGIHRLPPLHPGTWRRALRDLVGHGEGIFGLVDAFDDNVPGVPLRRLRHIEEACVAWRWRLRDMEDRLCRTHGDFHPFNVLFNGDQPVLLDASRGAQGDPGDDVACMAINFIFFAQERPQTWADSLGRLWDRFWAGYLKGAPGADVRVSAPVFLAWRALVLCHPGWYPNVTAAQRTRVLDFVDAALASPVFDPHSAHGVFA